MAQVTGIGGIFFKPKGVGWVRTSSPFVVERTDGYEYGRFGWIRDPEGTRIELWEPRQS